MARGLGQAISPVKQEKRQISEYLMSVSYCVHTAAGSHSFSMCVLTICATRSDCAASIIFMCLRLFMLINVHIYLG